MDVSTVVLDFIKVYGPLSLGWVVAAYLGNFILKRYDADIDARTKLALALDSLSKIIDDKVENHH